MPLRNSSAVNNINNELTWLSALILLFFAKLKEVCMKIQEGLVNNVIKNRLRYCPILSSTVPLILSETFTLQVRTYSINCMLFNL